MPADPSDGLGRAFIVQCTVTGSSGGIATHRAIVGAESDLGHVPFCVDEELERNATHGWCEELNEMLAEAGGGGGGPVTLPLTADHGDVLLEGEINAGGSDAPLVSWGTVTNDTLTFGDNTLVAGIEQRVKTAGTYKWYVNNGEIVELTPTNLDLQSCGLILSGDIQHGAGPASAGDFRVSTGWYANGRNDAGDADVLLLGWGVGSPDVLEIGEVAVAGMAFGVATSGGYTWRVNGSEIAYFDDTHFDLESLILRQGTQVATTGSYRVGATWSLIGLNETLSADRDILTYGSGTVTVGGTTADTSVVRGTSGVNINVNGSNKVTFNSTTAAFGSTILSGSAVAFTGGTVSDGVNLVASSLNEAVANSASSTNIDTAISASTTELYRIEADAEISGGTRAYVLGMARVVRSGSSAPTVGTFQIQMTEGSGLAVSATISSNNLRVSVANTMGSGCRLDTRIWRISSKSTVEHS
jgi:hypothetical protein